MPNLNITLEAGHDKLPTMYWLPKLHKVPYKSRFIANARNSTSNNLSKLLTSCLTAIKQHVIRYCDKAYENSGVNLFWSIKNSMDVINKLRLKGFQVSAVSTYDFSTLYTTLPHGLIKEKLVQLIEKTFAREGKPYLACNFDKAFFTLDCSTNYTLWSCTDVCEALTFLIDNVYTKFGSKLFRQIIGIPMGTNCAPLVADLFLFCYERDFMIRMSSQGRDDVVKAFNDTSRYLDDVLVIDNPFFSSMHKSIYPPQLTLIKANSDDSEAAFLDLNLTIIDGVISTKIYDKRDDYNFDIVNYPHLDGDVPRATSYGVYISQLIRFARACNSVSDFNTRNQIITNKLLNQGYRYNKLRKAFTKFYRRNSELVNKYSTNLKTFLQLGIAHPTFYGDVLYKLRKLLHSDSFDIRFPIYIKKCINSGYNRAILKLTASLAIDCSTLDRQASLFNCTSAVH